MTIIEKLENHQAGRIAAACAGLFLAVLASGCQGSAKSAEAAGATPSAVERGRYLVTVAGCNDCHTPLKMGPNGPEPDRALLLSGHPASLRMPPAPAPQGPWLWSGGATNTAFAGPWGVSYSANLTPDQETGIGIWTEETFVKTLRSGKHWGQGRPILPPMPWQGAAAMTDGDLKAVYAYLRTVPPVRNSVPNAVPAPPPPTQGAPAPGAAGR